MTLFDTHCHFDFPEFADPQQDLALAKRVGVEKIVIPATGQKNWQKIQSLSEQYENIYFSLGLHPYFIEDHYSDSLPDIIECLRLQLHTAPHDKCVAIGECGLDFALPQWMNKNGRGEVVDLHQLQRDLFDAQIQLAKEAELPLIIHSRKSHNEVIARLKQYRPNQGGVIHAFSGSYQQAMQYIGLGFYIGVGGVITYERANKTRRAIAQLPQDKLVLETDAPDMPLSGMQGRANHPANLNRIFTVLCELVQANPEQLANQLWKNSHNLFRL